MPAFKTDQSAAVPTDAGNTSDPTDVLQRRIGAFLLDTALVVMTAMAVAGGAVQPQLEEFQTVDEANAFCDAALNPAKPNLKCIPIDNGTLQLDTSGLWLAAVAIFGMWLVLALVEGLTGATIGKHLVGLRVIHADGSRVRIGAAVLRSGAAVVDGLPFGLPMLVGFFFAASSPGHQRLGDRLAGTFVVDRTAVGTPLPALEDLDPMLPYPFPSTQASPFPSTHAGSLTQTVPSTAVPTAGIPLATDAPATEPLPASPLPLPPGVRWDETSESYLFNDGERSLRWDEASQKWQPQRWEPRAGQTGSGPEHPHGT